MTLKNPEFLKMLAANITKSYLWCQRSIPVNETHSLEGSARICRRCFEKKKKKFIPSSKISNLKKYKLLSRSSFYIGKEFLHPRGLVEMSEERGQTSDSEPGGVGSGKARAAGM